MSTHAPAANSYPAAQAPHTESPAPLQVTGPSQFSTGAHALQLTPSPQVPASQAQPKPPSLFVHVASASQPALPFAHSSTSTHASTPSPGSFQKPGTQAEQLKVPGAFTQTSRSPQSSLSRKHSSMSRHVCPSKAKPASHWPHCESLASVHVTAPWQPGTGAQATQAADGP